jgi:hypothetical protein
MDIQTLTRFFMWCTILNGSLLMLSFLIFVFARGWVCRMHTRWFPMPEATFNVVVYSSLGLFKVLVLVFNVIPYVALTILG